MEATVIDQVKEKSGDKQASGDPEIVEVPTRAGHAITARIFRTGVSPVKGVCVIAPATGVAQYLYDDFAHWLTTA